MEGGGRGGRGGRTYARLESDVRIEKGRERRAKRERERKSADRKNSRETDSGEKAGLWRKREGVKRDHA